MLISAPLGLYSQLKQTIYVYVIRYMYMSTQEDTLRYDFQDFEDCAISFMPGENRYE